MTFTVPTVWLVLALCAAVIALYAAVLYVAARAATRVIRGEYRRAEEAVR